MQVAAIIVEYIKALAWPVVTFILVLRFQKVLTQILAGLSDRLRTADKLKLGVMGQEVELSGTAKELLERHDELLRAEPGGRRSKEAADIEEAARRLRNPMSDIVGIALLHAADRGLAIEEIVSQMLDSFATEAPQPRPQFLLISMATEIEKIVDALENAQLAAAHNGRVCLTPQGIDVFSAVERKQSAFIKRFSQLAARPQKGAYS